MDDADIGEMDATERDDFLGTGGTGVVSFSTTGDEPPHTVPVSYGYDAAESNFYFRLAVGSDSAKADPAGRAVSFVVYGHEADGWRSVVATGSLEATTEASIATDTLQGLERVHIPLVDVFGEPPKDVPFEFFRLVPAELTARREDRTEL